MRIENFYSSILICVVPLVAVYLCLTFMMKDFKWWRGLIAVGLGFVAVVPIAAIQMFMDRNGFFSGNSVSSVLMSALVVSGILEETIKLALLFCMPVKNVEQKVFFSCGLLMGLSLACFEAFIYLISGYEKIGLRFATSVLIHLTCAGLSSLVVYCIKNRKWYVAPFLFAVVLHGVYAYFAGFYTPIKYFSLAVIAVALLECRTRYVKVSGEDSLGY